MRILLLLFVAVQFGQASAGTIKIRFLNGIQNSTQDMEESKNALFNAYRLYKSTEMPKLTLADFSVYQNPKDKLIIGDNVELAIQGTISGIAQKYAQTEYELKMAKAKVAGLEVADVVASQWYNAIYQRTLTEYYANYLAASNTVGTINIAGVINDTLSHLRNDMVDGSSVVVVSHSQGNLFAEAIYSQLTASERKRVRFVGVASVASSTPNNRYVTFNTDLAVFGAFNGLRAAVAPFASAPLPKTDDGYYAGPEGISSFWDAIKDIFTPLSFSKCVQRTINCPSYMGHSFIDVYLNSYVVNSSDDLTPVASKIVGMIGESISELLANQNQPTDGYAIKNVVGTSADSSISLFTGAGAGGLSNVNMAPNDANVAYGIANYSQGGATKVGVFFLNQPNGLWYLTEESSSFLAVNDLGQAIVVRTNAQTLPATSTYYFISKANDGTMYKLYLPVPSGAFSIIGLMKNGNIVGVQGANTIIFDKTMQPITTINTVYSGIGGDGLMFGVDSQQNKIVRFADGSQATLPCNVATGQTDLTKPSSGRNCSSIIAANSNGVVVGSYYNADGTRGVFKYSKAGFTEIPIASNYYGYGGASTNTAPPRPVGISDAGDILLAPIYSDQYQQTCAGGPFVLTGSAITDLRTAYLPNGNCWNIQAGISGGGNIYMSSQAQGYAVFLQKN